MSRAAARLIAALVLFASQPSYATVLDFELPRGYNGPTYTQDDFILSFTRDNHRDGSTVESNKVFLNWIQLGSPSFNANGANATVTTDYAYMTSTISSVSKSPFIFTGISLADGFNTTKGGLIDFTFNHADGTTEKQVIELKHITGLQDFSFNITNVTSVMFSSRTTTDTLMQFDFFRYESVTNSSLPEPSTWAFMLIGFGVIGYSTRRTRLRSMRMQAV